MINYLVNYYSPFCKKLQEKLKMLYDLVGKTKLFKWTQNNEEVFIYAKQELASDRILLHFDPDKPVRLA